MHAAKRPQSLPCREPALRWEPKRWIAHFIPFLLVCQQKPPSWTDRPSPTQAYCSGWKYLPLMTPASASGIWIAVHSSSAACLRQKLFTHWEDGVGMVGGKKNNKKKIKMCDSSLPKQMYCHVDSKNNLISHHDIYRITIFTQHILALKSHNILLWGSEKIL